MAIRAFGPATFKIISEMVLDKAMIGGGQSNEVLYFNNYVRTAEIYFPIKKTLFNVQYREFQTLTATGVGNFVSIEMFYPVKFSVMEFGIYAKSRSEEALCRHIKKIFFGAIIGS